MKSRFYSHEGGLRVGSVLVIYQQRPLEGARLGRHSPFGAGPRRQSHAGTAGTVSFPDLIRRSLCINMIRHTTEDKDQEHAEIMLIKMERSDCLT